MRPATRVVRLTALVAVALSVGWLLLRRRIRPGRAPRAAPDLPEPAPPAAPPQPRTPQPRTPAEPAPVEPRAPEPVSSIGRPVHDAAQVGAVDGGAVELGTAPAEAATGVEERTDDLRRIRGVGPAIESALHRLGVRSYRQLATLDAAGLERVRDAVHDRWQRIEREDWIGQARQLHREKYGEEV